MLTVQNVLVVLADRQVAQPAWSSAQAWGRVSGARLHLFLPLPADAPEVAGVSPGQELDAWPAEGVAPASRTVTRTARWCESVLHEARRQEADLLVVSADSAKPRDLQHLMRQLPCPVYLARRGLPPRRVAAAVGLSAEDDVHRLLNTVVLEHLVAVAQLWQAERRVISAIPSPADLTPLIGDAYAVNYVSAEFEQPFRKRLEEEAAPLGIAAPDIVTVTGRPGIALPDVVQDQNIDCLLLGTVGRQALAAFWLGNTAEDVLPRVDCDVMILRPQDYYTPPGS